MSSTKSGLNVPGGGGGDDAWAAAKADTPPTPDERRYKLLKNLSDLHGRGILSPDGPHRLDGGYAFRWEISGITVLISHFPEDANGHGHAGEGEYMLEIGRGSTRTVTLVSGLPSAQVLLVRHMWGEMWGGTVRLMSQLSFALDQMERESRPTDVESGPKESEPPEKSL